MPFSILSPLFKCTPRPSMAYLKWAHQSKQGLQTPAYTAEQLCESLCGHRTLPNLKECASSIGKTAELFKDTVLAKQSIFCTPATVCPQIHLYPSLLCVPEPCGFPMPPCQWASHRSIRGGPTKRLQDRRKGKGQGVSPHFSLARAASLSLQLPEDRLP